MPETFRIATGERENYHWVTAEFRYDPLSSLLRDIPDIVRGRVVAITAFDSGPLRPNDTEQSLGWHCLGDILWTTRIEDATVLPHEYCDEWYVFDAEKELPALQVLVNYGDFRLDDPEAILKANPTWDRSLFQTQLRLQEVFWGQVCRFGPVSFLSNGDRFNFATRDAVLGRTVASWCRRHSR